MALPVGGTVFVGTIELPGAGVSGAEVTSILLGCPDKMFLAFSLSSSAFRSTPGELMSFRGLMTLLPPTLCGLPACTVGCGS